MEGRQTELWLVEVSLRLLAGKVSNQCGTDSMGAGGSTANICVWNLTVDDPC